MKDTTIARGHEIHASRRHRAHPSARGVAGGTAPAPVSDYFSALQEQITSTLGSLVSGTTYLIDAGSQGDFAYNYVNPANEQFNLWTYNYLSARVQQGSQPNSVLLQNGGSYEQGYIELANQLVYHLDTADAAALQTALNSAQTEGGDVVQAYETNFAPITAAQLAAAAKQLNVNTAITPFTNIDFVIDYVLGANWSATSTTSPPLTRKQMQSAENLPALLPNMPADGQAVVDLVTRYLNIMGAANQLSDQQTYGGWAIGQMQNNLQSANLPNGPAGMLVFDPSNPATTQWVAAYQIPMSLDAIQQSLNGGSSITMTLQVQQSSSSQSSVSINGGAAFDFGDGILDVSGSVSAQYNMTTTAGAGQAITISLDYAGVTVVPLEPQAWTGAVLPPTNGTPPTVGWCSASILQQAYTNFKAGENAPSGFNFLNPPEFDLDGLPAGTFDNLTQVIISQYPAITIEYTAGDYSTFSQSFATQTNATVSFLGIPIGGENSSTYSAQASQGSSNEQFSVTLTPNSQSTIPLNEQRAYVLAGVPLSAASPAG